MAKKKEEEIIYNEEIIEQSLDQVLHNAMLPYSEHVILNRAVPRIEDGLKPVQRRILYSMYQMGLHPDKPYKKCATTIGDVLAKYHPHGDSSVYDALARMAQPFSMRMKLIEGQGNFGSIDGDPPAAYRYTECRLENLALELLRDIDKETIQWSLNFDDSREEPVTLPGRFPNLLVNGTSGIAVGIATNIPPHNLGETIDATIAMIENPNITVEELLEIIKGPDFPTGGLVYQDDSFVDIYKTGNGKVRVRATVKVENEKNGKRCLVMTEIPYTTTKQKILEEIEALQESGKYAELDNIIEVVDESDKLGMRGVIRCKKEARIERILDILYQKTSLETTFGYNMFTIVNGKPELLGLIPILQHYIEYQRNIILNRTQYELKVAEARREIVQGLLIAINNIDEVIQIIKTSESTVHARERLAERFGLSEVQTQAIVDMRLKSLTKLEIHTLQEELERLEKTIAYCLSVIKSKAKQYNVLKKELGEIKGKYNAPRQTAISQEITTEQAKAIKQKVLEENIEGVLVLYTSGLTKFMPKKSYTIGRTDLTNYEKEDLPIQAVSVSNRGTIFGFTDKGNIIKVDLAKIKERKWKDKGLTTVHMCDEAKSSEKIIKYFFFNATPVGEFVFFTKGGIVKRTDVTEFSNMKKITPAITLVPGDDLLNVDLKTEEEETRVLLVTEGGMTLSYDVNEISVQGKKAQGVRGITLKEKDKIAFGVFVKDEGELIVGTRNGYFKRVIIPTLAMGGRGQVGLKLVPLEETNNGKVVKDELVYLDTVREPFDILLITTRKTGTINTEDIKVLTRLAPGDQLSKFKVEGIVPVLTDRID